MPSNSAESISKQLFGHLATVNQNSTNITMIENGPYIDKLQEKQFNILLPSFIYTTVLLSVGLPGNFLVMAVYLFKMAKTTSRHFIITLAICDFFNCAFGMPVELSLLFNYYDFDFPILCKVSRFWTFFMNNVSSLVLLAIAVDRFRRVCRPLKPNMTVTHSKIICIVVGIIAMLSAIPSLFIYDTQKIILPGPSNDTRLLLKTCYVSYKSVPKLPIIFSLYLYIFVVTQFLAMAIMYACVGRVVYKSRSGNSKFSMPQYTCRPNETQDRPSKFSTRLLRTLSEYSPNLLRKTTKNTPKLQDMPPEITEPLKSSDRANSDTSVRRHGGKDIRAGRTTLILFVVTLFFVISFIPYLTIATWRYINPILHKSMNSDELSAYNLFLRSYLLNSAVNPLIYCFLNRQFRQKAKVFLLSCITCGRY